MPVLNKPDLGSAMEYLQYRPSGPIATRVRCIWALRSPGTGPQPFEPVFPDGCSELILNLAEPFERARAQDTERQGPALFAGQMLGAVFIRPTGTIDLIGVRFHPWGAYRLVDAPPAGLVDRIAPGESLLRVLSGELMPALAEVADLTARCQLLEVTLTRQLHGGLEGPPPVLVALASGQVRRVSQAARLAGITPRQLERVCNRWIGIPPSELLQLLRFQRVLQRLKAHPEVELSRLALEGGFADQAHLTRDFRRFAGVTPGAFRRDPGDLTGTFIDDPHLSPAEA